MLFIFAYRKFAAASVGACLKQVQCEKCQGRFAYELVRMGHGSDASPYMLRDDAAAESAKMQAQSDLNRHLEKETDPVPCPHCGWMQQDMISDMDNAKGSGVFAVMAWR